MEWHEGQVLPVPKSGTSLTQIDIGAKVFNSMMCKRLFKVIKAYGCHTLLSPHWVYGAKMDHLSSKRLFTPTTSTT